LLLLASMQTFNLFLISVLLAASSGCRDSIVSVHANSNRIGYSEATTPTSQDTAVANLGREIFFDANLSASGKLSCASCHSPSHAYGPPNARAVQLGGSTLTTPGLRAVPSLRYTLARTPMWAHPRPTSLAERLTETDNGPAGGFAWDGRFNTLHEQAAFPLLAPSEMASSKEALVRKIQQGPNAAQFRQVFGQDIFATVDKVFAAVLRAIERFELEDPSFHPYSSKYDLYLDGKAALTPQEQRGLVLFNDGSRGNCASCHFSARGADGSHPLFTDFQFETIGVPRNPEIPANRDAKFYDLGLCGPLRKDQSSTQSYCGMFKTPSLRNVATRRVFFHNGRFHTLKEVLRFYVERDINPDKWYPRNGGDKFDDLPASLRTNVDLTTPPLSRKKGETPVWNDKEIDDVIAFLETLNDADQTSRP
jgi:cytochrome c peroxidase